MDLQKIKEKDIKLTKACETLKTEFFGIDSVIDGVISNFRSWYLFPESIRKPIVINLWGMTGCGKTSLVKRLCELLDINSEMMYYNLAKLDEDSSDDMEDNIKDNISTKGKNPVFVLDEFQYAATIDSVGKEKDNKTALKTIWELIDTGKLYSKISKYTLNQLSKIQFVVSVMSNTKVQVVDGKLVNLDDIFENKKLSSYYYSFSKYFNCNYDKWTPECDQEWSNMLDDYVDNDECVWVSAITLVTIYDIYNAVIDNECSFDALKCMVAGMNIKQLSSFLMNLEDKSKRGFYKDYSNSLIFVIGNIDEAYNISYDMNPDMDADLFNEMTSKLTVVDIKSALQKRFRNEQIARLGNIMFLYPSFSVSDFNRIIEHYVDMAFDNVRNYFGMKIEADQSILDIIYKENVFPTQGTRPIMSGIYEIVETKISTFVVMAVDKYNKKVSDMRISFNNGKVCADVTIEDGTKDRFEIEHQLRVEDKRKNRHNETQAVTAVHESGHFVMYAKLFGKMPKKLVSNCVSSNASGFMMPVTDDDEFISKDDYMKHISVDLAGYAAELLVFGEKNLTSGASSDIDKATETASNMVRKFGMCPDQVPAVYTYMTDPLSTNNGCDLKTDNESVNAYIKSIISKCLSEINDTFNDKDWHRMLAMSSEYMFENTSMDNSTMTEIYNTVPEEKRTANIRPDEYYREKLHDLCNSFEKN